MIFFLLGFIIVELAFIIFFFYYAIYEPFSNKRRFSIYEDVKKEIEQEKIFNSYKK